MAPFVNVKIEMLKSNAGLRVTKLSSVPHHTHTPSEPGLSYQKCSQCERQPFVLIFSVLFGKKVHPWKWIPF